MKLRLTERDDDIASKVRYVRQEDERATDADNAHEAEDRDAHDERERDLPRAVGAAQGAPVPVKYGRDVYYEHNRA